MVAVVYSHWFLVEYLVVVAIPLIHLSVVHTC